MNKEQGTTNKEPLRFASMGSPLGGKQGTGEQGTDESRKSIAPGFSPGRKNRMMKALAKKNRGIQNRGTDEQMNRGTDEQMNKDQETPACPCVAGPVRRRGGTAEQGTSPDPKGARGVNNQ